MTALSIVGLRFDRLPPADQSLFMFGEDQLRAACVKIKKQTLSRSVLLLSTCDRIELWCEQPKTSIAENMLRNLALSPLTWAGKVYTIPSERCLLHVFCLAAGLLSPLFGEDQIIGQLQQALNRSTQVGCASSMLSYLVRESVTVAKYIQTTIDLQVVDPNIAEAVLSLASPYRGEPALVIGGSALARYVAFRLAQAGYMVTMTFRDLKKADGLVPPNVKAAAYEERIALLDACHVVVSATKGMEYTLTKEQVGDASHLYLDLAPVRDIDPEIDGVITIEELGVSLPKREEATQKALAIIDAACSKVHSYLAYRSSVPDVQNLASDAANDVVYRLNSVFRKLGEQGLELENQVYETARKAFSHHLYAQKKAEANRVFLDLSAPLESGQASYAGDPAVQLTVFHTLQKEGWRLTKLEFGSHSGTHMDSPAHMLEEGRSLDQIPVSQFFATAYVMDCASSSTIAVSSAANVPADCDAILFHTQGKAHVSTEAVAYLIGRGVRMFGFDTANCDQGGDLTFPIHHLILGGGGLILENLVNLEHILNRTVQLTALPLSYLHADGSPARVVASYDA